MSGHVGLPTQAFIDRHTTEVKLADGTPVLLRPITPDDKRLLADGFGRLSPESRHSRFFVTQSELSAQMLAYLTEIDYVDHFAWAAFAGDDRIGAGVARYIRLRDRPEAAEAAVTVVDDFQQRGIGSLLLEALTVVALEHGVTAFVGHVLVENDAMRAILEHAGARLKFDSPGVLRFEIDLPAQVSELRSTPLYAVLRAVARGEGRLSA
jgi:GNAT superfamily N-acetyltransferase